MLMRKEEAVDRQKVIHVALLVAGDIAASRKEAILQNRAKVSVLGHVNQRVRHIGELASLDFQGCSRNIGFA